MSSVLLIDHSGRGHAFADLFTRTNRRVQVYYAPGCSAITTERITSLPALKLSDPLALAHFAQQEGVDFALVTNAGALANGVVDELRRLHIPVIGPDKQAACLESSKTYGKQFCVKYGIPTAEFALFDDVQQAISYVKHIDYQVVVKADGLCDGNGSFVCSTADDALHAIDRIMVQRDFGAAGERIVIERRLFGVELLLFALLDGEHFLLLPTAMDYPRSDDGDRGVICGGMGSLSPHPLEEANLMQLLCQKILLPILHGIQCEQLHYTGVIYIGCMLVDNQPYVLEINARMGDPEAESILPRIESDFFAICQSILTRTLQEHALHVNNLHFCDIVATQGKTQQIVKGKNKGWYQGWPYGRYGKHYRITGIDQIAPEQCKLFIGQASVLPEKGLVTDGGRPLHIVGFGDSRSTAVKHAYTNIQKIHFNGMRYRSDIGRFPDDGE